MCNFFIFKERMYTQINEHSNKLNKIFHYYAALTTYLNSVTQ